MEKSYIIKSKLKYSSKVDDKKIIDFDIKINSNHVLDDFVLNDIEQYFVTNANLRNYNKINKNKEK